MSDHQARYPAQILAIWAEDEHRVGLLPIRRRVWAPRGRRPIAPGTRRYQWLYVYGFVRPSTGQTWWCLLPTVSVAAMSAALAAFAHDEGINADHPTLLVLDNAGWHHSPRLTVPPGLELAFLPPYAPELQPAERLWPLLNEAVANRAFPDLDALAEVLCARTQVLASDRDRVRRATHFHWWPADSPAPTFLK